MRNAILGNDLKVIVDERSYLEEVNFALFADTSTMMGEFNSTSEGTLLII